MACVCLGPSGTTSSTSVDLNITLDLTGYGGFAFLEDLQDTNNIWKLRDVRMPRIAPKGEAQRALAACFLLVLALAVHWRTSTLHNLRAQSALLLGFCRPC